MQGGGGTRRTFCAPKKTASRQGRGVDIGDVEKLFKFFGVQGDFCKSPPRPPPAPYLRHVRWKHLSQTPKG